jgi:hypothetical protein
MVVSITVSSCKRLDISYTCVLSFIYQDVMDLMFFQQMLETYLCIS